MYDQNINRPKASDETSTADFSYKSDYSEQEIQIFFENKPNITSLCIGGRNLDFWFQHLKKLPLTHLIIADGLLTEKLFKNLSCFSSLQHLEISFCNGLTKDFFDVLSTLKNLIYLKIDESDCIDDKDLSSLSNSTSLTSLYFSNPNITDEGFKYLSKMQQLCVLDIRYCNLTDRGFQHLATLNNIKELSFTRCNFTDLSLKNLSYFKNLIKLKISQCPLISQNGLQDITQLDQLQELCLEGIFKIEPKKDSNLEIDDWLYRLSKLCNIKSLSLESNNCLTTKGLKQIKHLTKLENLNLSRCRAWDNSHPVTEDVMQAIAELTHLKYLNLSHCDLTDQKIKPIGLLQQLTSLNFSASNEITNEGLCMIGNLPKLTKLDLSYCKKIPWNALESLSFFKNLEYLNLGGCKEVTDQIYQNLTVLKSLKNLCLYDCSYHFTNAGFTEKRLEYLSFFNDLEYLDLSRCDLLTNNNVHYLCNLKSLIYINLYKCTEISEKGITNLFSQLPNLKIVNTTACLGLLKSHRGYLTRDVLNSKKFINQEEDVNL